MASTETNAAPIEENPAVHEVSFQVESADGLDQVASVQNVAMQQNFPGAFQAPITGGDGAQENGGHASNEGKEHPSVFHIHGNGEDGSLLVAPLSDERVAREGDVQDHLGDMQESIQMEPKQETEGLLSHQILFSPGEASHTPVPALHVQPSLGMITPSPGLRMVSPLELSARRGSDQRKRIQLDGIQKKFICELKRDNPKFTAADISNAFADRYHRDLPRSTVSDILKRAAFWLRLEDDTHEARIIRHRSVKFPSVEEALFDWYQQVKIQGGSLSDQVLVERAKAIRDEMQISDHDFKVSNGWLQNFKRRHNIKPFTSVMESESKALSVLIKESNCKPEDVFAFEERSLHYRAPPLKPPILESGKSKGKQKDMVTVGLCVHSGPGLAIPPVVIGSEPHLACFGKSWTPENAGVQYYSNPTASMTAEIFEHWIGKVNHQMLSQRRHVLLFVNDASFHRIPELEVQEIRGYEGYKLSNITIIFIRQGMPVFQPIDLGIFQSFRCLYKKFLLSWFLEQMSLSAEGEFKIDSVLLNLKQGICFIQEAWQSLETYLIRACWAKSFLLPREWSVDIVDPDEVERSRSISSANELASLSMRLNLDSTVALPMTEYLNMPGECSSFDDMNLEDFGDVPKADNVGSGSRGGLDLNEDAEQAPGEKRRESGDALDCFFVSDNNTEEQAGMEDNPGKLKSGEDFLDANQFA